MDGDQQEASSGRADEAGPAVEDPSRHRRRRLGLVGAAVVLLVVAVPLVGWWRNRPLAVHPLLDIDGRACFVVDGRVWWTSGTVTPAPERQSSITGGFKQTGPHDGVFATSGTSIPVTTPPTTHDPRLAVGCPVR